MVWSPRIVYQVNNKRLGIWSLHLAKVGRFGRAPTVDALVWISDGGEAFVRGGEERHELELDVVRVLELVEEDRFDDRRDPQAVMRR